ncbi:MAG: alpha-amylase [Deltaproteobacteria bacterium]|nr:alpha-amylase [Deltaproteobacteria bacterium]
MPSMLFDDEVIATLAAARKSSEIDVSLPGGPTRIPRPFPSPLDWRDHWIYFLMIDRFNNPAAPPRSIWDRATGDRQGGTFEGVRQRLNYIRELGAGAIWLTPVLKNRQSDASHHGYGIMDFLEVDPRFGTRPDRAEAELVQLIDEAHAHGLYVILDIVLNHAGDVFAYKVNGAIRDAADWRQDPYTIHWRDLDGTPRQDWTDAPDNPARDAALWPSELRKNLWMRRQGKGGPLQGDFETLKEFKTEQTDEFNDKPVWNLLIRIYQYIIAKFDVDGFRIDTLKHVERDFALTFCNAIREYAYSIGKKNFFIFGETKDDEHILAEYTGRYTSEEEGRFGADASLDFPLQWKLAPAIKGFAPPTVIEDVFSLRKKIQQEKNLLSTHGEASRFFVTFLDNHDDHSRFLYPRDGGDYSSQLTLAIGCLLSLQGICCLYYGTEQGLQGTEELYAESVAHKPENVREALWGKANAFDQAHPIYRQVQKIAEVRASEPALRYGRQYFRPVSGNNRDFGPSKEPGGILAFSRILNDREILIVANTSVSDNFSGWVLIDARINNDDRRFDLAYSNHGATGRSQAVSGPVTFHRRDGSTSDGWARRLPVELAPMELQLLAPED